MIWRTNWRPEPDILRMSTSFAAGPNRLLLSILFYFFSFFDQKKLPYSFSVLQNWISFLLFIIFFFKYSQTKLFCPFTLRLFPFTLSNLTSDSKEGWKKKWSSPRTRGYQRSHTMMRTDSLKWERTKLLQRMLNIEDQLIGIFTATTSLPPIH